MDSGASSSEQTERLAYRKVGQQMIGPTEAELVQAMKPGALERDLAWREFHKRHGVRLMEFILRMMGPHRRSDCDDLYQDTVIRIDDALTRYQHRREGGFHSWCLKIAQNVCISACRVKAGHPSPSEILSFEELEESISAPNESDLESPRPRTHREEDITWAFTQLNSVDQAVIWLRRITHTPDAEIARVVKKPVNQIRQIREKALKKLKRFYEKAEARRKQR
jgi:RNA polymerase sigma factor (sigma-70 family)